MFPSGNHRAGCIVANNKCIRLRTVQQTEAHTRVTGVEQRALTFDDIPVIFIIVR